MPIRRIVALIDRFRGCVAVRTDANRRDAPEALLDRAALERETFRSLPRRDLRLEWPCAAGCLADVAPQLARALPEAQILLDHCDLRLYRPPASHRGNTASRSCGAAKCETNRIFPPGAAMETDSLPRHICLQVEGPGRAFSDLFGAGRLIGPPSISPPGRRAMAGGSAAAGPKSP